MNIDEIRSWLREDDPEKLQTLWNQADALRRENVGEAVFLRGLIEISNNCRRNCLYCGIRAGNVKPERYGMTLPELLETARLAKRLGYGTLVIQSGETNLPWITEAISQIRRETGLAITLSLGERTEDDYRRWFEAGASRYLLRFETSNPHLFNAIHPSPLSRYSGAPRIEILKSLRKIGYEIGSGVMAGIPGQSWDDLARDIALFGKLDLDMIGCGPFLPHPDTPLGDPTVDLRSLGLPVLNPEDQVSRDATLPFKVIALSRLVCPMANIPSTTAVATLDPNRGRLLGLSRGANVVMPNLTPTKYRKMYEIYPNKAASFESPEQTHETAVRQIEELGRPLGLGPGNSPRFTFSRAAQTPVNNFSDRITGSTG